VWTSSQETFTSYGEALATLSAEDTQYFAFTRPGVYALSWTTKHSSSSTAAVAIRVKRATVDVYMGVSTKVGVGQLDNHLSNSTIIPIKLDEIVGGSNEIRFALQSENFADAMTIISETLVRIVRLGDNTADLTGLLE
jgi:hypothetical protein